MIANSMLDSSMLGWLASVLLVLLLLIMQHSGRQLRCAACCLGSQRCHMPLHSSAHGGGLVI